MTKTDTADDAALLEQLAIQFARLQAEHASRSEEEGRRRSREAIRSWGERVPAALEDRARNPK